MTAAYAWRRIGTADGAHGHVQYGFCAAPQERSGSEHDLTGWLDDIPTSPGLCLPLKNSDIRHSFNCLPFSFYTTNKKKKKSWEEKIHWVVKSLLSTLLMGFYLKP